MNLTHLRLDDLGLASLSFDILSELPSVTNLYLQHNQLTRMEAVAALPKLRFLTIADNLIQKVRCYID